MKQIAACIVIGVITLSFNAFTETIGDGWGYRKKVMFNTTSAGANVTKDVAKYPVAVMLTQANFDFSQADANGADIRFTDENSNLLPYEIELWDKAGSKAAIWVLVTNVKGNSSSQFLYMYWGKSGAQSAGNSKAVFAKANGWMGVWHLGEDGNSDSAGYKEATENEAYATGVNFKSGNTVPGRIGMAPEFKYSEKRHIKIHDEKRKLFQVPGKMTLSVWINAKTFPEDYTVIMSKGNGSWMIQRFSFNPTLGPCVSVQASGYTHFCAENKPGMTSIKFNTWYFVTVIYEKPVSGSEARITMYINDKRDVTDNDGAPWKESDYPVGIGYQAQGTSKFWDGILDEARLCAGKRDTNWIKLDYQSQREGQKFTTFGATEELGTGIVPSLASEPITKSNSLKQMDIFSLDGRKIATVKKTDGETVKQRIENSLQGVYIYRSVYMDNTEFSRIVRVIKN